VRYWSVAPITSTSAGIDAQLLVRFAQRGFDGGLAGIELAAGEGRLPGVRAHVRGAVDHQHAGAVRMAGPVGYGDQHGSGAQGRAGERAPVLVGGRDRIGMACRVQRGEMGAQAAHAGSRPKRAPWLSTASVSGSDTSSAWSISWP